ncbi:MAG: PDZ domain-containing protein, partial [Pirellulaceae bacterium]|nr:PDZ domain-containing protein [Pirellulaceae bacterium]
VVSSYQPIEYDWSPDGKWFVYAASDADSNRNVWIAPLDGSREPVNVSRHPDNERNPVWSPDGKMIAFTGRRMDNEVDICFVMLTKEEDETGSRDRTIERAESKMAKARGADKAKKGDEAKDKADSKTVAIDFDDIHERVRRVSSPGAEAGLFWSHDSKKLAFTSTIDGKRGTYTISPPASLKPALLSTRTGDQATWLAAGNQIVWLSGSVPGSLSATGSAQSYGFSVVQEIDRAARHRAAFDLCWRTMRDFYYDEALNNKNWDDIRRKYASVAGESLTSDELREVVHLMLGELNGSHLGFTIFERGSGFSRGGSPSPVTAHLGVRFDESHRGPGLKVRDVIPGGPAAKQKSRIESGETILAIDGRNVDPDCDLTGILNGPLDRDIRLTVVDAEDKSREVVLRPISYSTAGGLLYEAWIRRNRREVEEKSKGTLGYLHIRKMAMPEFYRFEQEIYAAGAGKDGLIIDVRENPGGMIADHLLTILCQPQHAITVGRGGEPGYPQDRMVYASWNKPIVVLCNQNSGSNAEIFSHAVKTLKRGQLVGVPTCGGVISTGSAPIMDVGIIRVPFRGWFVPEDGRDMELNGAVPHHVVWPEPGDLSAGIDRQLEKAIRVLGRDVAKEKKRPRPTLQKASGK